MLSNRKSPEKLSSEFIKVVYDEKGRAIKVVPVENPPYPSDNSDHTSVQENTRPKVQNYLPVKIVGEDVVNWIGNLAQQVKALREDIRLMALFTQKKFDELQPIILNQIENSTSKTSSVFIKRLGFIENQVSALNSSLKNHYDLVIENLKQVSEEINILTKKLKELEGIKALEPLINNLEPLINKIDSLDLRLSNITNEIAGSKLHEIETSKNLESFIEEVRNSRIFLEEEMKKEIKKLSEEISSTNSLINNSIGDVNNYIDSIASHLNQKISELSSLKDEVMEKIDSVILRIDSLVLNQKENFKKINEIEEKLSDPRVNEELELVKTELGKLEAELETLKTQIVDSIKELYEVMKEFSEKQSEKQDQIKTDLLINQEKVNATVNAVNNINELFLKIQKMLKKPKKRIVKPQRAKVVRFLKKNFKIKPFSKVLVITDKRNSVFGKTLYEATRKISKKSVFATVESVKSLDRLIGAIKNSNYVFVASNSLKTKLDIRNVVQNKIILIKRTLKYSLI